MWNQDDAKQDKFKPVQPVDTSAASKPKLGDNNDPKTAQFGRSICVKGEITGSEDLTVDGQVDGRIGLPNHTLTVGPNATICADITAKTVMIFGTVLGSVTAHERIEIRRSGSVEGNVTCARLVVQDGAILCGKVDARGDRRSSQATVTESAQVLAPVA